MALSDARAHTDDRVTVNHVEGGIREKRTSGLVSAQRSAQSAPLRAAAACRCPSPVSSTPRRGAAEARLRSRTDGDGGIRIVRVCSDSAITLRARRQQAATSARRAHPRLTAGGPRLSPEAISELRGGGWFAVVPRRRDYHVDGC